MLINGDTRDEADSEVFSVILSNATELGGITKSVGVGTINDNDAAPTVCFASTSLDLYGGQQRGNSGQFCAPAFGVSERPVSVQVTTTDGTAKSTGVRPDFVRSTTSSATFTPGTSTGTFTVPVSILGDTTDEPNETFTVQLSDAQFATIGRAKATGTSPITMQGHPFW